MTWTKLALNLESSYLYLLITSMNYNADSVAGSF